MSERENLSEIGKLSDSGQIAAEFTGSWWRERVEEARDVAQNAHDGLAGFDPLVRAQPRLKRRLWRLRRKLDHILDGKAPESAAVDPMAELASLLVEASKLVESAGEAAVPCPTEKEVANALATYPSWRRRLAPPAVSAPSD